MLTQVQCPKCATLLHADVQPRPDGSSEVTVWCASCPEDVVGIAETLDTAVAELAEQLRLQ